MFSGYLMTAVINLDGKGGFKGWQWYVKISQFLSMALARKADVPMQGSISWMGLYPYRSPWPVSSCSLMILAIVVPGILQKRYIPCKLYYRRTYLTGYRFQDKETARARMRQEKRQLRQPYTRAKVIKILTTWHIYLLPLLFLSVDLLILRIGTLTRYGTVLLVAPVLQVSQYSLCTSNNLSTPNTRCSRSTTILLPPPGYRSFVHFSTLGYLILS